MLWQEPTGPGVISGDVRGGPTGTPKGHRRAPAPLHRGLVGAAAVPLIATLGTDYTYYTTAIWQWANFSAWLITAGLIIMLFAVILLLIDFATGRAGRLKGRSFTLVTAAALLSVVNAFVHSRDAWTSVVPQGVFLSAVSTILLLLAGARGWSLSKHRASGECT